MKSVLPENGFHVGFKDLVCIFLSAEGKIVTSELFMIVAAGDSVRLEQVLSDYLAGYKLGKCNSVKKLHFEYRFKYYIQP